MRAKLEVRSFTRSWDNRGYPKKLGSLWIRPSSLFSNIFHGLLLEWALLLFWPNLKSIASPISEIIVIEVLGGGCEPQSCGRGGHKGSGMVPLERALVISYRPFIVTFPLSLRVSEILPLLCSGTPLFSTPPQVFSKFRHVPLGVGGWPLGYEEALG